MIGWILVLGCTQALGWGAKQIGTGDFHRLRFTPVGIPAGKYKLQLAQINWVPPSPETFHHGIQALRLKYSDGKNTVELVEVPAVGSRPYDAFKVYSLGYFDNGGRPGDLIAFRNVVHTNVVLILRGGNAAELDRIKRSLRRIDQKKIG